MIRFLLSCALIASLCVAGRGPDDVPITESELKAMQTIEDFHEMLVFAAQKRGLGLSYRGPTASPNRGPHAYVKAATWLLTEGGPVLPDRIFIANVRIVANELPTFITLNGRRLYVEFSDVNEKPLAVDKPWMRSASRRANSLVRFRGSTSC